VLHSEAESPPSGGGRPRPIRVPFSPDNDHRVTIWTSVAVTARGHRQVLATAQVAELVRTARRNHLPDRIGLVLVRPLYEGRTVRGDTDTMPTENVYDLAEGPCLRLEAVHMLPRPLRDAIACSSEVADSA
jgi:hypothetical protein